MNFRDAIRMCVMQYEKRSLDYSIDFSEIDYRAYIDRFRYEIMGFLPVDYLAYYHNHEDWYYHTTSKWCAQEIIKNGYFDREMFSENGGVGKAIYTFPASSGRCYIGGEDKVTLRFKANEKHYHIVGATDSIHALGECIFNTDKLYFDDLEILSEDKLEKDRWKYFKPVKSLTHDFGFNTSELNSDCELLNLDNLKSFVNSKFNSCLFKDDFYEDINKKVSDLCELENNSLKSTSLF